MVTRTDLNFTLHLHIPVLFLVLPEKFWSSNLNGRTNYIISSLQKSLTTVLILDSIENVAHKVC